VHQQQRQRAERGQRVVQGLLGRVDGGATRWATRTMRNTASVHPCAGDDAGAARLAGSNSTATRPP
jgi:hypothetical protein